MPSQCSIDIKSAGSDHFEVWPRAGNNATAVIRKGQQIDFDRRVLGLVTSPRYRGPKGEPGIFTKQEAVHVAHQIGRYFFKLGDLVFTYTTVDGKLNPGFFEE